MAAAALAAVLLQTGLCARLLTACTSARAGDGRLRRAGLVPGTPGARAGLDGRAPAARGRSRPNTRDALSFALVTAGGRTARLCGGRRGGAGPLRRAAVARHRALGGPQRRGLRPGAVDRVAAPGRINNRGDRHVRRSPRFVPAEWMGVEPTAACSAQPATNFEDCGIHRDTSTPADQHNAPGGARQEIQRRAALLRKARVQETRQSVESGRRPGESAAR